MPPHVQQFVYQGMAFSRAALKVKVVRASAPESPSSAAKAAVIHGPRTARLKAMP
jgi:hypothetical protein